MKGPNEQFFFAVDLRAHIAFTTLDAAVLIFLPPCRWAMAIVCSSLGRRAASCLQLECCRRNTVLKPSTFSREPLSCVALGEGMQVFCRTIPMRFPYCRSNHLLVGRAAHCLFCANVRSCGKFSGFSTLPGGGTSDLPSAHPEKASSPDAADGKKGSPHTEQAASSAANNPTDLAGSSSRVHRPLISFRNALKRLEMLGLLPSQPQSVRASERRDKDEKGELQGPARPGSSSVVLRYNGLEDLPPFLLRPALSPEEVEAINDGGVTNLDAAAKAWSVSMSFHPVPAGAGSPKALRAKRASA